MKNIFYPLSAIVLPICMMASCQNKNEVTYGETTWADSTDYAYVKLDIELPADDSPVSANIRQSLLEMMDKQISETIDTTYTTPAEGPAKTISDYAAAYGTAVLEKYTIESKEINDFRMANNPEDAQLPLMPFSADFKLEKAYETKSYVVFHNTNSIYCGGAHPNETGAGHLTYSLADGSMLTEIVDTARLKDLQPLLRAGLEEYFQMQTDKKVNLDEVLQLETPLVPLPKRMPYPTAEGLTFEYMQYEIACYAVGLPTFTIPYDKIEPFLLPQARQLLLKGQEK